MKICLLNLLAIALIGNAQAQYANPIGYSGIGLNPLTSSYSNYSYRNTYPNIMTSQFTGAASVLPSSTYVVTSAPGAANLTTSANIVPTYAPAVPSPTAGFPHTHANDPVTYAAPAAPAPAPAPVYTAPAPAAPAFNPLNQSLTYPQIFSYLLGGYGPAVGNNFSNQTSNGLIQCKSYCDSLPRSPVCDSANTLYRNTCVAKCLSRSTSTSNLRYGMCCCSDDDFDYDNRDHIVHSTAGVTETNICLTPCIYNCMGGSSEIEDEHTDVSLDLAQNSGNACNAITA